MEDFVSLGHTSLILIFFCSCMCGWAVHHLDSSHRCSVPYGSMESGACHHLCPHPVDHPIPHLEAPTKSYQGFFYGEDFKCVNIQLNFQ